MKAEQITKGSKLLAMLNKDNFPIGMIKELHDLIDEAIEVNKPKWISIEDEIPEFKSEVLVIRKRKDLKKDDVLTARFWDKKEEGTTYGYLGQLVTYGYTWSLPAIIPFENVSHWMPLPKPITK